MSKAIIDSKISISEKVNELPIEAQLLYTWMIPHVDDVGLIQASPKTIKAKVVPMHDFSTQNVEKWIDQMVRSGLLRYVTWTGRQYLHLESHLKNQKKRRDIQPQTILEFNVEKSPKKSWVNLEKLIDSLLLEERNAPLRDVTSPDISVTKDKLSKAKLINNQRKSAENKKTTKPNELKRINPNDSNIPNTPVSGVYHEWQYLAAEHAKILGFKPNKQWYKVYRDNSQTTLFKAFETTKEMEPVDPEKYFYKLISKTKKE